MRIPKLFSFVLLFIVFASTLMLEIVVRYSELSSFGSAEFRSYRISDHKKSFVHMSFVLCV